MTGDRRLAMELRSLLLRLPVLQAIPGRNSEIPTVAASLPVARSLPAIDLSRRIPKFAGSNLRAQLQARSRIHLQRITIRNCSDAAALPRTLNRADLTQGLGANPVRYLRGTNALSRDIANRSVEAIWTFGDQAKITTNRSCGLIKSHG